MLNVYQSNRMEGLLGQLIKLVLQSDSSPLQPKTIVVENPGLAHWLKMQLAQTLGIAANIQFPMPSRFFWQLQRDLVSDSQEAWQTESIFNKDPLTWFVFDVLSESQILQRPGFELLADYVKDSDDESLRLYQLSTRIADIYDQYLVYRPDWIKSWEQQTFAIDGQPLEEARWQAELWQILRQEAISRGFPLHHRASLTEDFLHLLQTAESIESLPKDVIFFGFSTLPKNQIESLALLSSHCDVHLLTPNPSQTYWGDILDERLQARLRLRGKSVPMADSGNALLASLGRMGQEYQRLLLDLDVYEEHDLFVDADDQSLLGRIQNQILHLQQSSSQPEHIEPNDDSIKIVGCHSAMREVEVLHDHLLDLLQQSDVDPQDIVVMIPDVARYAPYIDAVFQGGVDNRQGDRVRIPYSISDRPIQEEHPLINGFIQLLNMPKSRMSYSEVIALLEIPAVYRKFDLDEKQLHQVKQWLELAAIRWGYDETHRSKQGLPKWQQNTWLHGFQRLLMGYAFSERLAPNDELPFDISPVENVEGLEAASLGPVMNFVNELYEFVLATENLHSCTEWRYFLQDSLQRFFDVTTEEQPVLEQIHQVLENWLQTSQYVNFSHDIPFSVVYQGVQQGLQKNNGSQHFMIGRVNFCTLLPMRSIPFKYVAVLGLNDQEYPRTVPGNSLDLMRFNRRVGDRNRRDEDRYLFLEAILSARQGLWLSYRSLDQKQNTPMTPSVVLAEFMDYLDINFFSGESAASQILFTQHPLQAFNRQYFIAGSKLHSYQTNWFKSIYQLQSDANQTFQEEKGKSSVPVLSQPNGINMLEVGLSTLVRFFQLPARAFLNQQLNIQFHNLADMHEDEEPFELSGLDRYAAKDYILQQTIQGRSIDPRRLQPWLPFGKIGERHWQRTRQSVEDVLAEATSMGLENKEGPLEINLACEYQNGQNTSLVGWINEVYQGRLVLLKVAKFQAKHLIELLIESAALNAQGYNYSGCLVTQDIRINVKPMSASEAKSYLNKLLSYYFSHQNQPLNFMPETAWALYNPTTKQDLRSQKALQRFVEVNDYSYYDPERLDPHYHRCFGNVSILPEQLIEVAHDLFEPFVGGDKLEVSQ
ncbi:exodeoxyribonuclease V subunit gamma [Bermanella marisrubri]|uniref:RecBCD enzyme subunit RecC n=1 Tax=Bermanella marisrubri TaxID=207949 RepID=Q1N2R1_9GAMM|nr:exodeoxyribonuclease V subunit gamma [Bermanella marisrubri]EAT12608.1 exonuclease V gamma subunit [Oceanobacter sp. RED65] [Bermanella marisrubri]QIZ84839.1 exodeoxyribonuclease V subunit gamma [Bermanella marisrubri]